jgi:hypothetical protein
VKVQHPKAQGAFRRVLGLGDAPRALWFDCALRTARTSSPCSHHSSRQQSCGFFPASSPVAGLPCGSPNADDAGCVRPTSASHHSVNEHPRLVDSQLCGRFDPSHPGRGILHGTPLASAGRAPSFDAGRFLPRAEALDRTSDIPSLLRASTSWGASLFRRFITLPESLDRFLHDPRDGIAAPSTRGAFHRHVPSPPPERRFRPRAVTRTFPDPAVLHTATRFSTPVRSRRSPLLAFAIGEDPPLARPRPRELVVRLEEDPAHAFLGQALPADFCNTTRRAGTPFEHSILAREFGEAAASFSSLLAQRR